MSVYDIKLEKLLLSTPSQESLGGFYLHQISGPAISIYEMEPATFHRTMTTFLVEEEKGIGSEHLTINQISMINNTFDLYLGQPASYRNWPPELMAGNLYFATIMAALNYCFSQEYKSMKDCSIDELWRVYKTHWNTMEGKATKEEFVRNYQEFIKT